MYKHTVQYYETDKMGITHHSNYIRWMEEARVAFLAEIGYGYDKLEEDGIISPVIGIACDYKHATTFADVVTIDVHVQEFKGVRLKLRYIMTNEAGDTVCEAYSEHCFLNEEGRPILLKRQFPEFCEVLTSLIE